MYDTITYTGRFQPFHNGHKKTIHDAFEKTDTVILIIGSIGSARTPKNPFTFEERELMINLVFSEYLKLNNKKLIIRGVRDVRDDNTWVNDVKSIIYDACSDHGIDYHSGNHGFTGLNKDSSSFYLDLFHEFHQEHTSYHKTGTGINIDGTGIRNIWFMLGNQLLDYVPQAVHDYIETFPEDVFNDLKLEHQYYLDYKISWDSAPYRVNFVTVDAALIVNDHILLVKRGGLPGKGLLAIPGGFLDTNEPVVDGMIRELREETEIDLPDSTIKESIRKVITVDDPNRSLRGRVISFVHLIEVDCIDLPKVVNDVVLENGEIEITEQLWVPISELSSMSSEFFEDHWLILNDLGLIK